MAAPMRTSRISHTAAIVALVLSGVVFWRTAYPTVTWWDSSSYSLAAATLGVSSPPGSLLLALIGWPVAQLTFGTATGHALNLFAGLLAAISVTFVCVVAQRMLRLTQRSDGSGNAAAERATAIGVTLGALTFAFSGTLWAYAVKFTPYVLSAVFTGLILWTMLRWWENAERPNAWRWLALLGLLFGLDFSVHRTNALLIPGAIVWILMRHAATLRSPRSVLAGVGGLVAGLAVQLLLIPIAAFTQSPLNFNEPNNLSRFWDYITIKQLGGSFLLQLFPRKAPILSVQTADFLQVLGDNFLHVSGGVSALGVLPAVAALVGLGVLWRGNQRLTAAFAIVLLLQSAFTVLYFNIPANYFREFNRHYLPVCVTIAVLVACGLGAAMRRLAEMMHDRKWNVAVAIPVLAALFPAAQLAANWATQNASERYFTRDYAANALLGLPRNAIYFTVGDNDTFPVMYAQSVEGIRPDVTIINMSVANIPEWPDQLRRRDPSFPLSLPLDQRRALSARPWTDSSVTIPVTGTPAHFGLPSGTTLPQSITLDVRPVSGPRMLPAEVVLLDIVRTNAWKRPLAFAITGGSSAMSWLSPFGRLEGFYYRIVPLREVPIDIERVRAQVLESAQYRGYADSSVRIDDATRSLGMQSYVALGLLLEADRASGALDQCRADRATLLAKLPLGRMRPPPGFQRQIESACGE